ncbi:MAG: nucleoside phosphorylase [Bacteroidetes bacterium]|nr:nucleoside phosphorylase [Bacteroidota bacterium]
MAKLEASELTLDKNGKVYHLGIGPGDIADTVLLVGDQDRVKFIGSFFDSIRFEAQNREFCSLTGTYKGRELTVLSTGIGTDNIDIVLNELDALVNIDLATRTEKTTKKSLNLIRIGTCGSLQELLPPGAHVISKYAIGLDGVANFYEIPYSADELNAATEFISRTGWNSRLNTPYFKKSSDELFDLLKADMTAGITITANGFYGPQGRAIRIPLSLPDFKNSIRQFSWNGVQVTNLEMETSALYALSDALGHKAVTVCLVLANRYTNSFEPNYSQKMAHLIECVLNRLTELR